MHSTSTECEGGDDVREFFNEAQKYKSMTREFLSLIRHYCFQDMRQGTVWKSPDTLAISDIANCADNVEQHSMSAVKPERLYSV